MVLVVVVPNGNVKDSLRTPPHTMTRTRILITCILTLSPEVSSFSTDAFLQTRRKGHNACRVATAGRGFAGGGGRSKNDGNGSGARQKASSSEQSMPPAKTYGDSSTARPIRDLIDSEAAMGEFFAGREEWMPLFRRISLDECPATDILAGSVPPVSSTATTSFEFHETSTPWRMFPAIPTDADDRQVLAGFLDSMQQSLLDIPVTDSPHDDDNDIQFVEEGRRLLALSRFHVLRRGRRTQPIGVASNDNNGAGESDVGSSSTLLESYDSLFATAWSELLYLIRTAEEHTGSLILLPDHEMADVRRFADMNLQRPLEWLGLQDQFEVASLRRDSPAIRLLYRLRDIPTTTTTTAEGGDEGMEDESDVA